MGGPADSDLTRPLGRKPKPRPPRRFGRRVATGIAIFSFAVLIGGGIAAFVAGDPEAARPRAVAGIESVTAPLAGLPSDPAPAEPTPQRQASNAEQLEQDAGVTVVRPGSDAPGSIVIRVPEQGVRLAAAPDPRVSERARIGLLPRIGEGGARPSQVYARPVDAAAQRAPVRIAVLLGGLGISSQGTSDAISRLPGEISFAFAPYGTDLARLVQRARSDGHEVFLQLPMEPFDYPDNDPGPHTLTVQGAGAQNLEKLHWLMSRYAGYVGIVNFLGARLTATPEALAQVLEEVSRRGLLIVDDATSPRSLMTATAAQLRAPALRADVALDAATRGEAIDRELARLEALARERGFALAVGSALPLTVERVARWTATLEAKGITLVPVSAGAVARASTTGAVR